MPSFRPILLLLVACLLSSTAQASLIISKEVSGLPSRLALSDSGRYERNPVVRGADATVTLTLFNAGDKLIENVVIVDKSFKDTAAYTLVSGKPSAKFASIAVNANRTLTFVVRPNVVGGVRDYPAVAEYTVEKTPKTAYSASKGAISIISQRDYAANFAQNGDKWTLFLLASVAAAGIPFYLHQTAAEGIQGDKVKAQ
ncbi:translocon-associated protein beta-domain-containing protein [Blyttiomyces helicus]|uniref:Translocon-associated protein beta-domain-containing protein n=1 Tax=Blyttiomyces helicus TaxID=388810 RepID=A0A4P9W8P4_9FUNG|nr:translocon-associated protein beta-domain-containing protein [Blyttiomyces helicus]|eukprot:RKO88502.1 translocon-associated protein beta-domain-containing protein [Blyttiomyces helicus]